MTSGIGDLASRTELLLAEALFSTVVAAFVLLGVMVAVTADDELRLFLTG